MIVFGTWSAFLKWELVFPQGVDFEHHRQWFRSQGFVQACRREVERNPPAMQKAVALCADLLLFWTCPVELDSCHSWSLQQHEEKGLVVLVLPHPPITKHSSCPVQWGGWRAAGPTSSPPPMAPPLTHAGTVLGSRRGQQKPLPNFGPGRLSICRPQRSCLGERQDKNGQAF